MPTFQDLIKRRCQCQCVFLMSLQSNFQQIVILILPKTEHNFKQLLWFQRQEQMCWVGQGNHVLTVLKTSKLVHLGIKKMSLYSRDQTKLDYLMPKFRNQIFGNGNFANLEQNLTCKDPKNKFFFNNETRHIQKGQKAHCKTHIFWKPCENFGQKPKLSQNFV